MRSHLLQGLMLIAFLSCLALKTPAATNQVLVLAGATDYMEIPATEPLAVSPKFTVECWFKPLVLAETGAQTMIGRRRPGGGTGFAVGTTDGHFRFSLNDGLGNNFTGISDRAAQPGVWQHIAAVYDGAVAEIYVDGEKVYSGALALALEPSSYPITIGREDLPGETRWATGWYEEVRIWNKARTQEEIQFAMFTSLVGDEPNLQGYWRFDSGQPTDSSFYGNHGVLRGQAGIEADGRLLLNVARAVELYFDPGLDFGRFQLQVKTVGGEWSDFGEPEQGTGKEIRVFDGARSPDRKFYRIIRLE